MKYFSYLVVFALWFYKSNAQNACSHSKLAPSFKSATAALPPGYEPPENKYDLKFYHLNINIERNSLFISGNVLSKAQVVVPSLDSFAFVLHENHIIDSVYVNGAKRDFVRQDSLVKANAGTPILQNQLFDAIVYYHGTCPDAGTAAIGNGYNMGTSGSWGNEVTWSLSESFVAYEWFPCKQDLRDKIDSSWVFATTDAANMVGSNGKLANTVTVGSKKRYEWKSKYPIDYYLISVATAKYNEYNLYAKPQYLVNDSILIQNFIYDSAINDTQWNNQKSELNKIKPTMNLFCNLFGMYPFYKEKYGHCMAPFGGGMEHQTMTSLGFFEFELDAHELGHQWWGDHVTCASWKDIFINEGFASYTEYLSCQYLSSISGKSGFAKMNEVHNSVMSEPGGSSYFTNSDTMKTSRIFSSRLTYDKGSAIIHALRFEINNDSVFFGALRGFQQQYGHNVASVIDFKNYMQTYTGLPLTQFFNQWYYGEGYPTFNVVWNQVNNIFMCKTTQTQSMPSSVPLFITPLEYRISRAAKPDTIIRMLHDDAVKSFSIALTGTVTNIFLDPNNWILNKLIGPVQDPWLLSVGVDEHSKPMIFIGPNPTSDVLNVYTYHHDHAIVEVMDMTGKLLLAKTINAQTAELDISKFSNGAYLVNVKNNQGELLKTTKIIKQ